MDVETLVKTGIYMVLTMASINCVYLCFLATYIDDKIK